MPGRCAGKDAAIFDGVDNYAAVNKAADDIATIALNGRSRRLVSSDANDGAQKRHKPMTVWPPLGNRRSSRIDFRFFLQGFLHLLGKEEVT